MSGEICSKETSLDEANTGGGGGGGEVPPAGEANTGGGGGNNEVPSSGEANTGGDNTSPSDESLVSHLAGGATEDVVKQALEHAIAARAAKTAEMINKANKESEEALVKSAALLFKIDKYIERRGLLHVFQIDKMTAGLLGPFHTAVLGSLEGRVFSLSINQDSLLRGLLSEFDFLKGLVKASQKPDSEVVVINHVKEEAMDKFTVVPKENFMKFFSRKFSGIADKSTPAAICALAMTEIVEQHHIVFSLFPLIFTPPKQRDIWKNIHIYIKGLVNMEESAPAKKTTAADEVGGAAPASLEVPPVAESAAGGVVSPTRKGRGKNRAENQSRRFKEICQGRVRQTEEQLAARKQARQTEEELAAPKQAAAAAAVPPARALTADDLMRAVKKSGPAVAAAPSEAVVAKVAVATKVLAVKNAKSLKRAALRMAQMAKALVSPHSAKLLNGALMLKDPVLAGVEMFLNGLQDPNFKRWCETKEEWLDQLEFLRKKFKGKKSIPAKVGIFLCSERVREVTEDFNSDWRDLREEVADLINDLMIRSDGLDPLSAYGKYLKSINSVKLCSVDLKLARFYPVVDVLAQYFTPLFENYPLPKPVAESGEDLMARVLRELKKAIAMVPALLTPNGEHGEGANIKRIMDVLGELLGCVLRSPSVLDFIRVAALYLQMKSVPEISRFINIWVFKALLAGTDTNKVALANLAEDFVKPDAMLFGHSWCPHPDLLDPLVFPASLVVPKLDDEDEDEDDHAEAEEPIDDLADETGDGDPETGPAVAVAAAVAVDGGQAAPAVEPPASTPQKKKRKTTSSEAGESSSAPPRRSTRVRAVSLLGRDFDMS